MNTVIVGQGAIGLLCYHRLSKVIQHQSNSANISLWSSKETQCSHYVFSEMAAKGSEFPLVIADEDALANAQVIIVCVKSYQVVNALQTIAHLIADDTIIILTHNGLGTFEEIQHLLKPRQCLLALLLTQGAKKHADYQIEHTGLGDSDIGIISGRIKQRVQDELLSYLQHGLTRVHWQENIKQAQWKKLAINCVINPITAIENIKNGDINQLGYQDKIKQIIEEIIAVATCENIKLVKESLLDIVKTVAKNTEKNTSSMRADILAKRCSEIDYINGYIHHLGKKHQLATPINTQLWLAVKALDIDA